MLSNIECIAGLLGFIFIKAYVALGTKLGFKMKPFTAQENTVIQTTTVSCYGLAWYGGFATYLFSMTPKIQQVLGDNPGDFLLFVYLFLVKLLDLVFDLMH